MSRLVIPRDWFDTKFLIGIDLRAADILCGLPPVFCDRDLPELRRRIAYWQLQWEKEQDDLSRTRSGDAAG